MQRRVLIYAIVIAASVAAIAGLLQLGESWFPASGRQDGAVLRGTGASTGRVTATARVLSSPADFGRMRPGPP